MFPQLDFTEHLLNEPYLLSPYKLCVANYFLSYIEHKNAAEAASSNELPSFLGKTLKVPPMPKSTKKVPKMPNPLPHCFVGFRLIMSLDCSYAELRSQIVAPIDLGSKTSSGLSTSNSNHHHQMEKIDSAIIRRFDDYLIGIKLHGINKLYDFVKRLQRVLQRKPGTGRTGSSSHLNATTEDMYRIHKMSMAGLFLRKFIVHFERLGFGEVAILQNQLERYLQGETDYDYLETPPKNPVLDKFNTSKGKKTVTPKKKKNSGTKEPVFRTPQDVKIPTVGKIELNPTEMEQLSRLEDKLSTLPSNHNSELVRHLQSMITEVKRYRPSPPSPPKLRSSQSMFLDITSDTSDEDMKDYSYSSGSSMSLDDNSTGTMNWLRTASPQERQDWKEFTMKKKAKKFRKTLSKTLDLEPTETSEFAKFHSNQASQHFLLKQVFKILINEHSALSPPTIVEFINYYFEQHNRFHYNQFIQLNYKANLNMIRRQMVLEGAAAGSGAAEGGAAGGRREGGPAGAGGGGAAGAAGNNAAGGPAGGNAAAGAGNNLGFVASVIGTGGGAGAGGNKGVGRDLFQSINYHSDIYYLKFINALRVNNYTAAQECFYTYFDLKKSPRLPGGAGTGAGGVGLTSNGTTGTGGGTTGTNATAGTNSTAAANNNNNNGANSTAGSGPGSANFCWSSLNLAIMYAHFRHYRLAYEALTDCISVARERRDERCLQFAMIWLLLVLQQFNSDTVAGSSGTKAASISSRKLQNRAAELSHRHNRNYHDLNLIQNLLNLISINETSLPYIAAMAYLHLEKQIYLRPNNPSIMDEHLSLSGSIRKQAPRRPPLTTKPLILSTRYQLDDILLRSYALHAAVLNAYGAVHLGVIMSNILARLDLVDMVDQEQVPHVNENQAIACRNNAFYEWTVKGNYQRAMDQLNSFGKFYSQYNSSIRLIVEQAKAEIRFEKFVYAGDWTNAVRCINLVRLTNRTQSLMMLADLRRRQNEPIAALECIDYILTPGGSTSKTFTGKYRVPYASATLSGGTNGFFKQSYSTVDFVAANLGRGGGAALDEDEDLVVLSEMPSTVSSRVGTPTTPKIMGKLKSSREQQQQNHATTPVANTRIGGVHRIPSTLEPEEERALTAELDPYAWISCRLMQATILGDLSRLLDCVVKAQAHGFRVLESRALLEIARVQQNLFGQCVESQQIINSLMVRLLSSGTLKDLAFAYFLTASNHFYLHQKTESGQMKDRSLLDMPLRLMRAQKTINKKNNMNLKMMIENEVDNEQQQTVAMASAGPWTSLETATWANERAIVVWKKIGEKSALLEAFNLAALIEHEKGNRETRNAYAKQAKMVRAELLK